jgi:hypothetical protein
MHCHNRTRGSEEAAVEEHTIDVRDIDTEWFVDVRVFLDRARNRYLFPAESVERLGEAEPEDGTYALLDGQVIAEPEETEIGGIPYAVWSVPVGRLVTRPAAGI